ncbi:MAG: di-trans,poly-cis-decaprenylcistransferase [Puniceicoccales bacterium]|jgi:undecaprenyl diphosphate synthase|nr:di-trans,poly-cis-decaprenylcistransferase [Puniceicoccales bacterium]
MFSRDPVHVAIVMDGNRRWAKRNSFPIFYGHRRGVYRASKIIQVAIKQKIPYLTLFAFSTENWQRSAYEVTYLMRLFARSIDHYAAFLQKEAICIHFIGDLAPLKNDLRDKITAIQEKTRHNTKLFLTIAINYGSRDELVRAIKKILPDEFPNYSWESIRKQLDTGDIPDVDLFIRTSGEQRLSNFLLLQSAYAELFFIKKHWPEFTQQDFDMILDEYRSRKRNFGK